MTIILCADREDQLLPTVLSRCVRVRLGPWRSARSRRSSPTRRVADRADRGHRLARLAGGRPGDRAALARGPGGRRPPATRSPGRCSTWRARGRRARLASGASCSAGRRELVAALDRAGPTACRRAARRSAATRKRARTRPHRRAAARPRRSRPPATRTTTDGDPDADDAGRPGVRAPAAERRRAAAALVEIWRDVARDLAARRARRGAAPSRSGAARRPARASDLPPTSSRAFLVRLDRPRS